MLRMSTVLLYLNQPMSYHHSYMFIVVCVCVQVSECETIITLGASQLDNSWVPLDLSDSRANSCMVTSVIL